MIRVLGFCDHAPATRDIAPAFEKATEWGLDAIVSQGTGSDFGPGWLGSGRQFPLRNFRENIVPYLQLARELGIPFIMSAGIAGADVQLDDCVDALDETCRNNGLAFDVAVISGEVSKTYLRDRVVSGSVCAPADDHPSIAPVLTVNAIDASERIVAQMGPEPIMAALADGLDGVITGRALDTGLYMAPALAGGATRATAAHLGKILEVGGSALKGGDAGTPVYGMIDGDTVEIRSPYDDLDATVESVAAVSFYERADPLLEPNPGGVLDLRNVTYEQLDPKTVRVSGAAWIDTPYAVKLEGASVVGYRSINFFGARDQRYIDALPFIFERLRTELRGHPQFAHLIEGDDYAISFDVYGASGGVPAADGFDVAVLVDVVASTQTLAQEICYFCYIGLWHKPYPGRKATGGNNGQRFSPPIVDMGEVFRWSAWHLLPLDDPCEPFARRDIRVGGR